MLGQRLFQTGSAALALLLLALTVTAVLRATGGHLTYTLDDPYIHLAVAESILRGGYGVNFPEFSAPSSSVIYPYLVAGLLLLGAQHWAPLILGALGAALSAWLLSGLLWRAVYVPGRPKTWVLALVLAAPLVLVPSVAALPMTGMEHPLHVAATIAIIAGLAGLNREDPTPAWFLVALLAAPLLRYEGLALTGVALLALLWHRKFADAAVVAAVVAVILGAFSYMLVQNGLPLLPSSVATKSPGAAEIIGASAKETQLLAHMANDLQRGLTNTSGRMHSAALALFAFAAAQRGPGLARRLTLGLCGAAAVLAHASIGAYGWFYRYEIYLNAMVVAALLVVYAPVLRDTSHLYFFKGLALVLGVALVASDPLKAALETPAASANIHGQQFQMHRFATQLMPHPVAVNDLGYVSYGNDQYVLDLWGLGSDAARRLTHSDGGPAPNDLALLAARKGAAYAMLYTDWFENGLPAQWCRVATLITSPRVTASGEEVAFFLIDPLYRADMAAALAAFAPTLPAGARLEHQSCD